MTINIIKKDKLKALTFESFISKTYGYMFSAMLITILTAFVMIRTKLVMNFFSINNGVVSLNLLGSIAFYAPFCTLLFLSFKKIDSFSVNKAKFTFYILAGMFGLMMSILVLSTNSNTVFQCLLGTGAIFAGSVLIGHYISVDLSIIGRIAYNLMFGIVIVSIIALLLGSPINSIITSYAIIAFSSVIVAYTHQNLKSTYSYFTYHANESDKIAIFGALSLYVDFINIFISLLNLSNRK